MDAAFDVEESNRRLVGWFVVGTNANLLYYVHRNSQLQLLLYAEPSLCDRCEHVLATIVGIDNRVERLSA